MMKLSADQLLAMVINKNQLISSLPRRSLSADQQLVMMTTGCQLVSS
jgi:hypothetical protein